MIRQFFTTTLGQILAIIASASAITLLLFLAILWLLPGVPPSPPWPWPAVYRIVGIVDSMTAVPESERALIAAAAQRPDLSIGITQAPITCVTLTSDARALEEILTSELTPLARTVVVRSCEDDPFSRPIQVLIKLDGHTIDFRTGRVRADPPRVTIPFVGALLFLSIAVAGMSAWAVWRVIRPLRRLSAKAEAFGESIAIAPITEEGPLEIRRAARAFNLMQERITRSIRHRTHMLAAVGHDLRSPLTRMRLQLEVHQPGDIRAKLLRDIDLMQAMVASALSYLSHGLDNEELEWLDLGALLQTLCDEYQESGADVRYQGPQPLRLFCRPNAINRAITNLVDNGIHFAKEVRITAGSDHGVVAIDVVDDGPGIPPEQLSEVIEPFVRLDPARSTKPGSVGLGLSIVKEIVESHNGTLALMPNTPHGLHVAIRLPEQARPPVPGQAPVTGRHRP